MRKIVLNIVFVLLSFSFLSFANSSEEKKLNQTELNFLLECLILVI